jgi:threonylcarbamoyladenosine tRNA methylthiotransferase MtaB
LDELFSLKDFAPHFHLSLQHGSGKVLRDMGRRYTPGEYLKAVELIREYDKKTAVTTDVIVGYPTEDGSAFEELREFVKAVAFSELHIFPFSAREGTRAASLKPLAPEIIKARKKVLAKDAKELNINYLTSLIGTEQRVIPEGNSGYSQYYVKLKVDNNTLIANSGKKPGQIIIVPHGLENFVK